MILFMVQSKLKIRRGDAINECDTRLKTTKAYFACPSKGTEEVGRHITLLVMSDERDVAYGQAIVDVVDAYPHISIVDLDSTVRRMVQEAVKEGSIPNGMDKNYCIFNTEKMVQR